jgi:hypothetical protein
MLARTQRAPAEVVNIAGAALNGKRCFPAKVKSLPVEHCCRIKVACGGEPIPGGGRGAAGLPVALLVVM